ncbi:MAG: hypothetical protein OHK93_008530 [Ramalina farinacea]|uniref:Uncharacterized protein n=1 Tax=Ramalina farinacea TaxID=258253 RepID=A0AA43QML0_9LECA|nr:hypothetical protein [Ramalina farinacea]
MAENGNRVVEPPPPCDDRKIKLGKTLRILQARLPSILVSPLPQEILSPHISLHLFPSTHPHLPTVSGRIAYHAALWTSPVAWGTIPIVGNVKLAILSERIVQNASFSPQSKQNTSINSESLIVRWKTLGKGRSEAISRINGSDSGDEPGNPGTQRQSSPSKHDQDFCGLFIFEFDEEGRILTHTIEHAEEDRHWERTSRVVSITDWLLGHVNGRKKEPQLAWNHVSYQQQLGKAG